MIRSAASKVMWVGRTAATIFGVALVLALIFGVATMAFAAAVGDPFRLGQLNRINDALTTLRGSNSEAMLAIDNNSTATTARALDLRVEPNITPMRVNSDRVVANLNADKLDGKGADELSRVALMESGATTPILATGTTYGSPLSITAPAAGFVQLNGNVTIHNSTQSPCTSDCKVYAGIQHVGGSGSVTSETSVVPSADQTANLGLDWVVPVDAGVNTFEIRLARDGNGMLQGWWAGLTAEYTPYGSTGGATLSSTDTMRSAATESGPITKEEPTR